MPAPTQKYDFVAALLTYLVPGLGQVKQGRIGKGLLFFVCLYGLFFYGITLGKNKNVWLANAKNLPTTTLPLINQPLSGVLKDLSYRKEFLAQFWMGVAAWPAIAQYHHCPELERPGSDEDKLWAAKPHPLFGTWMQPHSEAALNVAINREDTSWDLGWVLTVIAGVLNILVIYDALAGPLVKDDMNPDGTPKEPASVPLPPPPPAPPPSPPATFAPPTTPNGGAA